jgi:hypothetical protein
MESRKATITAAGVAGRTSIDLSQNRGGLAGERLAVGGDRLVAGSVVGEIGCHDGVVVLARLHIGSGHTNKLAAMSCWAST